MSELSETIETSVWAALLWELKNTDVKITLWAHPALNELEINLTKDDVVTRILVEISDLVFSEIRAAFEAR